MNEKELGGIVSVFVGAYISLMSFAYKNAFNEFLFGSPTPKVALLFIGAGFFLIGCLVYYEGRKSRVKRGKGKGPFNR